MASKKNYSNYRDVLDFMQDDTGMMETLLGTLECSWTDWRKFKGLVIIISFMAGAARRRKNGLAGLSENGRYGGKNGSFWPFDLRKSCTIMSR